MNVSQSFRMAIKSLMVSKARAILTMLGIIIGVAAVIVIVSLGTGMQNYMNAQFEQIGVNLIQVVIYQYGGSREAEPDDFYELADKYPQYIDSVSPYLTASTAVRHGADEYEHTSVYGVSETFYNAEKNQTANGETLDGGRFLSYVDVERNQKVCVIGSYLNQDMFHGDGIDQTITIGGVPYKVIGTMAETADSTEGSGDDCLYIPYGNVSQLNAASGGMGMNTYLVTSTSQDTSSTAKGVIESMLYRIYEDDGAYMVMTSAEMMDMMNSMLGVLMTILVVIAAISPGGGRHRHHEHHAGVRHRAHPGDRHPQVPGRQGAGYPQPVYHRGGHHLRHRRYHRHRPGHRAGQRVHRGGRRGNERGGGLCRCPQRGGHRCVLRRVGGHRRALRLSARQQGRQAQPHCIQCPLDTSLRAGETPATWLDTPGFAPRGAGRGVFPESEFPERRPLNFISTLTGGNSARHTLAEFTRMVYDKSM